MEVLKEVRVKKEPIFEDSQSISEIREATMRSNNEQTIEISDRKRNREAISSDSSNYQQPNKRRRLFKLAKRLIGDPIENEEVEVKAEEKFSTTKEFVNKTSIQTVSIAFLNDETTKSDNNPITNSNQSNKPNKSKVLSDNNGCFKCKTCQKRFTHSKKLKKHRRIHNGEKPYVCEICNKSFAELYSLEAHRISHTESHQRFQTGSEKPYVCEICNKRFIASYRLESHRISHFEERPYVCEICNKSFAELYSLEAHRTSHTESHQRSQTGSEKPYVCGICKKGFFRLTQLKKHHGKIHKRQQKL